MRARVAVGVGLALSFGALASCGARSSLDGAGADAGTSFVPGIHPDAARLAPLDAGVVDTGVLPPPDAAPYKNDCTDPTVTYVYAVSNADELFAFDPMMKTFSPIGVLNCQSLSHPFSMAVSRKGVAYVLYEDGQLFKVSTKTAACTPTPFVPGQAGFVRFGMGFATIAQGPAEQLFVAATGDTGSGGLSELAIIDTTTFALKPVAAFVPPQLGAELTGTGDGRLFGFTADDADPNASRVVQIDKKTAKITASVKLPGVPRGDGWAFGFWGGTFWLFTAPGGDARLTRYDPATGEIAEIAKLPQEIVGAGVSTCAPEE